MGLSTSNGHMLPPETLAEFHALRGGGDNHQWLIGQRVEIAASQFPAVPVRRLIREAAGEIECSAGQVRKCHDTWIGTDDDMRETFDVLTFQHFYVVSAYCRDRAERVKWLNWCIESADDFGGRPAPAGKLEAKLKKPLPEPTLTDILERLIGLADRAYDLDPAALWRELARYCEGAADDAAAGEARSELVFAASELKDSARLWGKAEKEEKA